MKLSANQTGPLKHSIVRQKEEGVGVINCGGEMAWARPLKEKTVRQEGENTIGERAKRP